jgi:hypothetical protein
VKVFISWSGLKSKAVAQLLKSWIPSVIQALAEDDLWMSEIDIESGANWSATIGKNLEIAEYGLICVTQENQQRTWLNFEAGAISKLIGNAVPLLIDFDDKNELAAGPMAQLQTRLITDDDLRKLLSDMNARMERPLKPPVFDTGFERGYPEFAKALGTILSTDYGTPTASRSRDDKIDEILSAVRDLARRPQEAELEALVAKYGGYPSGTPLSDMLEPANLNRLVGQTNSAELRLRIARKALELTLRDMSLGHLESKFYLGWVEPNLTSVIVPNDIFLDGQLFNTFQALFGQRVAGEITYRGEGNAVAEMLSNLEIIKETLERTLTLFGLPDVALQASHFNDDEIEVIEPHSLHASVSLKVADNLFAIFPSVKKIKFVRSGGAHVVDIDRPEPA